MQSVGVAVTLLALKKRATVGPMDHHRNWTADPAASGSKHLVCPRVSVLGGWIVICGLVVVVRCLVSETGEE